jgi:hypothetical protein
LSNFKVITRVYQNLKYTKEIRPKQLGFSFLKKLKPTKMAHYHGPLGWPVQTAAQTIFFLKNIIQSIAEFNDTVDNRNRSY